MSTATQQQSIRFISKGRNYRATLLSPVDHPHPITGQKVEDQRGFTAEFSRQPFAPKDHDSDGSFQWPPPEGDSYADCVDPETLEYVDPVSSARIDVVERLRTHADFGVLFSELGPDPEVLLAEQNALLAEIPRAALRRDLERLAEIYDVEEAGHKREAVLTASMEALRAVEEQVASEREPG